MRGMYCHFLGSHGPRLPAKGESPLRGKSGASWRDVRRREGSSSVAWGLYFWTKATTPIGRG